MKDNNRWLPLADIRIADMTIVLAGTGAASLMADWGAEVIRIEPSQALQPVTRTILAHMPQSLIDANKTWYYAFPNWDPGDHPWERYPFYHAHGKNKMSMTVDLKREEGRQILKNLVAVSDVLIENNVPETMEKLGVDYEELRSIKPDIIMVRMPAYGLSGPYSGYRSFGSHLEGAGGHTYIRGYEDSDPSANEDIYFGDACAAVSGAYAVALAIRRLKRTGKGGLIELSQSEALIPFFGENLIDYQMNGRITGPKGNDLYDMAPHNAYRCLGEDRWVAIAVGKDNEWAGLIHAMGDPDWAQDARFATQPGRYQHRRELDERINAWTAQHEDRWVMEILQENGVPAGTINDVSDMLTDPQLAARGFFEEFDRPYTGRNKYAGIVYKMGNTPNSVRFPPATLGQHNNHVYRDLLGLPDNEYVRLEREGHIGTTYGDNVP